jgi:hypothetical protein
VWVKRLAVALVFYPLLLLMSVYGGWLVAWAELGHRPDPVFDDPALAGWVVNAAIVAAAMLMMAAWPLFIVYLALVGVWFYRTLAPGSAPPRKFAVLAAAVLPWATAFLVLDADPGDVLKWAGLEPP